MEQLLRGMNVRSRNFEAATTVTSERGKKSADDIALCNLCRLLGVWDVTRRGSELEFPIASPSPRVVSPRTGNVNLHLSSLPISVTRSRPHQNVIYKTPILVLFMYGAICELQCLCAQSKARSHPLPEQEDLIEGTVDPKSTDTNMNSKRE